MAERHSSHSENHVYNGRSGDVIQRHTTWSRLQGPGGSKEAHPTQRSAYKRLEMLVPIRMSLQSFPGASALLPKLVSPKISETPWARAEPQHDVAEFLHCILK